MLRIRSPARWSAGVLDQAWDKNVDPLTSAVKVRIPNSEANPGSPTSSTPPPASATGSPTCPYRTSTRRQLKMQHPSGRCLPDLVSPQLTAQLAIKSALAWRGTGAAAAAARGLARAPTVICETPRLFGLAALMSLTGPVATGPVADRIGTRPLCLAASLVYAIGLALASRARRSGNWTSPWESVWGRGWPPCTFPRSPRCNGSLSFGAGWRPQSPPQAWAQAPSSARSRPPP